MKDNIQSGGRIHNFKDFMDFPEAVFEEKNPRKKPFIHPQLQNVNSVTNVIMEKDILLNFPYHSLELPWYEPKGRSTTTKHLSMPRTTEDA